MKLASSNLLALLTVLALIFPCSIIFGKQAAIRDFGGLETMPRIPQALSCNTYIVSGPDSEGHFVGKVTLKALLADTKVRLLFHQTANVALKERQSCRTGWLRKGKEREILVKGQLAKGTSLPTGMAVELQYRYPYQSAKAIVDSYESPITRQVTRNRLEQYENERTILSVNRSFFFAK